MGGSTPARGLDRRRRIVDGSRGATLVEMALVLPLLLMLLMGIVTAGIAYNHQLSLTHSAREAGRYGATLPVAAAGSMGDWLADVHDRAVASATASLDSGAPYVCVAYVYPDGSTANDQTTRLESGIPDQPPTGPACFDDDRPDEERRVQVRVERNADLNALVFQTTLRLDSQGVNRYEAALGS